jgi:hypothetical protein
MKTIPNLSSQSQEAVVCWVTMNCLRVTVDTLLSTAKPDTCVLQELLKRLRFVNKKRGLFHVSRAENSRESLSAQMREQSLRKEVHDWPDKFCFHMRELKEYHSVHLAEMIVIVLDLLLAQGIDCRVSTASPDIPGGIGFGDTPLLL